MEHNYLIHSAKGQTWKRHKYIRKEGTRYIYEDNTNSSQSNDQSDDPIKKFDPSLVGTKKGDSYYGPNLNNGGGMYASKEYWENLSSNTPGFDYEELLNQNFGNYKPITGESLSSQTNYKDKEKKINSALNRQNNNSMTINKITTSSKQSNNKTTKTSSRTFTLGPDGQTKPVKDEYVKAKTKADEWRKNSTNTAILKTAVKMLATDTINKGKNILKKLFG